MSLKKEKIAVIGSGIAGMSIAYLLHPHHDITVYEKEDYIGGHTHTVEVNTNGKNIPVDTGFIVYNHATYPNLIALFAHLGVAVQESKMSFGVSAAGGKIQYASTGLPGLLANRSQLNDFRYWKMLLDILKFNRSAHKILASNDEKLTLGEMIERLKLGAYFRHYYLLPMGGAIWSCPAETMLSYPAMTFLQFFKNHGLLTVNAHPQWYTVTGGSREYVKKITAGFKDRIRLKTAVQTIKRDESGVEITDQHGEFERYDQVVIAAHGNQAMAMLSDPSLQETEILSCFTYEKNQAVLHGDISQMPKERACWASWIYLSEDKGQGAEKIAVTYWMNNLQGLDEKVPLFVTLNPYRKPSNIYGEYQYEHPIFDHKATAAQKKIYEIQGVKRTWYCGSYQRYGFHEDALMSSIAVAKQMGIEIPWQQ